MPVETQKSSRYYLQESFRDLVTLVERFSDKYKHKIKHWRQNLKQMREPGQRSIVWGGGSKGVTFLNILETQNHIDYVIDINPRKQNHYIAGTGQQIMPPEFLRDYNPQIIIVMNPIYLGEIKQIIEKLGLDSLEIICV